MPTRRSQSIIFSTTLLCLALFLLQCKKDSRVGLLDMKYEYFPLEVGNWVIYQVDSITYNDFYTPPRIDTIKTQFKEVVESIFRDNEDRLTYRIERYRRYADTVPWTIHNVFTANLTESTAEILDDNLRFIKLVFPVNKGKSWKGNSYIMAEGEISYLKNWRYEYSAVDVPEIIDTLSFDSTLTVLQQDQENLIEKDFFQEKYAKNVGLIYKKAIHLNKQSINGNWESGFIVEQKIIDYKK